RGVPGTEVVGKNLLVAVDVCRPGGELAIRREPTRGYLPLALREPVDLFGSCLEQANVVVAITGVRGQQYPFSVGREIGGNIVMLTCVRCKERSLFGGHVRQENIGIFAVGVLLCENDRFAILRPDGVAVVLLLRCVGGKVTDSFGGNVN